MNDCPHIKRVSEYDGDTEDRCGLVPGLSCWGPGATQCPLKGEKMSELKPCPHCGGAPELHSNSDKTLWGVFCPTCGAQTAHEGFRSEGGATTAWNLRAQPANEPLTCEGCVNKGQYENELEYGYPSPCTRCKRRNTDNYRRPPKEGE